MLRAVKLLRIFFHYVLFYVGNVRFIIKPNIKPDKKATEYFAVNGRIKRMAVNAHRLASFFS